MQEKEYIKLDGTVEGIIFRSEETGYTVLELDTDEGEVTVVGSLIDVSEGEELSVTGFYTSHPVYGTQFKVQLCERRLPATSNAILKYLSSRAIKGIGPVLAKRLVAHFGDETLEMMEKDPDRLTEVAGISPKKAQDIAAEYQRLFGIRSVMAFLSRFGLNPVISVKIWHKWGFKAVDLIKENPFALCSWEIGLEFETVDMIARELGFAPDCDKRIKAAVIHTLRYNTNNGHTCLPQKKLCEKAALLTGMDIEATDRVIEEMCGENDLVGDTVNNVRYIYLPNLYAAETYVAGRIKLAGEEFFKPYPDETEKSEAQKAIEIQIDLLEENNGFKYAELQRKAIVSALTENLFILTGGPGTGKTTTINAMIELLEQRGDEVVLCAPTGRAAKRMSQLTGREAKTIHRVLEVDFAQPYDTGIRFKRDEKNPLKADVIIIDEMSMVDICLFESLLKAVKMTGRLIMVGDADQLPSVSCGNVLKDLIDSGAIATVQLNEIFRQAAESLIVTNAHKIVRGEYPDIRQHDNDFFFLRRVDNPTAVQTVVDLCVSRLPKSYGYSSMWDIQVLAPSRKGGLGTFELNKRLQEELNPKSPDKKEFTFNATVFREGDKIMQIRNNYDIEWQKGDESGMGIFNGDIGQILMIDKQSHTMKIQFDDRYAEYSFDMAQDLELSYACTVHKSQGSEFEAVILPLMRPSNKLYYRNLLYTAVTRAKKLLIIVGSEYALQYMIDNVKKTRRYTNLAEFISQAQQSSEA